ncbi:MAG: hypothetical protein ACKVP2_07250 [Burkholderiales bacterium]
MKNVQPVRAMVIGLVISVLTSTANQAVADPPENIGTPEETAKLAAVAGKYDIAGMKLGTPLKEAMQALKAHNPKLQMKKHTLRYDVLGGELLYGLSFTSPEERFIYELTMPPNPIVVSKLVRTLTFTKETAPTQQALVENLIKKYGPPSYDSGPNQLNDTNFRMINWLDDANGSRIKDETGTLCTSSQSFTGMPERTAEAAHMQPSGVAMLLESRWALGQGDPCETRRMVQARLKRCCQNALAAPDLVGALAVHIGDGPLNVQAIGATHQMLVNAVNAKDAKEKEGAQKNRPKL